MNNSVKVVQLTGLLTGSSAKQLRYQIDNLVSTGINIVLLDLENVTFIDSSGLGALISAQRIAKMASCQLFICSISNQVKMLFDLNKMERLFEIFANRQEFEKAFDSAELTTH